MIAGEILPPICIKTEKGIYDYEAKYSSSKTEYIFDSLNSDDENTIKELTRKSLLAIGVKRFGRVDFIFKENKFYILEANLIPGMTKSSLLPKAGNKVGYDYETIVLKIIDKEGR
jgi:D-alanine-D-alanine ligase